jgi:hypothetical protein
VTERLAVVLTTGAIVSGFWLIVLFHALSFGIHIGEQSGCEASP